jgi:DNA-binding transcriptional LysR family regulator
MKIENMITFRRVADERSYTRAAEGLFLTPSAVYQQVKQLEAEVGAKLVYVIGKDVRLTTEGSLVYAAAGEVEEAHSALFTRIAGIRERSLHVVRIGASSYFGIMAAAADSLGKRKPELSVEFETMRPWDAIDRLRAGAIDFGFVGSMHLEPDLTAEPCVENRIVIVVPAGHPLATSGPVPFDAVQRYSMVGYQDGSARRAIDRWATSRSRIQIVYAAQIISSIDIKTTALLMGLPAFVVESAVEEELASGVLQRVDVRDFSASYVLFAVFRRAGQSEAATQYLQELLSLRGTGVGRISPFTAEHLSEP